MPQETNLNINPYFDDFDKEKNFNRVLFKPSYPVQARELNSLQSMLQNQIEQFGDHMFKEGSIVIPGGVSYNSRYQCIELQNDFSGVDVSSYISALVGTTIRGEVTGIEALVDGFLTSEQSEKSNATLYVVYLRSGNDEESKTFADGENLITVSGVSLSNVLIGANETFATTIAQDAASTGSSFNVDDGVYFLRGHFVEIGAQTLILDQYTNEPSYKVGFNILEEIITADEDESLYDNAQGFNNFGAPGADRLKITATLSKRAIDDTDSDNFVQITQIRDGDILNTPTGPNYNHIQDSIAAARFDESGDYYIMPFDVDVEESLNDLEGNNGYFDAGESTYEGNEPSDDLMEFVVSPGKAVVRGYHINTEDETVIDVPKPRTTKAVEEQSIDFINGKTVRLTNVKGNPKIGLGNTYSVSLMDERSDGLPLEVAIGRTVGRARIYDFALEGGSYDSLNLQLNQYDASLFDVEFYQRIVFNTKVSLSTPLHVEGRNSGAQGYLVESTSNSRIFYLSDVSGRFLRNETVAFNGITTTGTIKHRWRYGLNDVKALYAERDDNIGISTFSADVNLRGFRSRRGTGNIGIASISLNAGAFPGICTITVADPDVFRFARPAHRFQDFQSGTEPPLVDPNGNLPTRSRLVGGDIIRWTDPRTNEQCFGRCVKRTSNDLNTSTFHVVGVATVSGITRNLPTETEYAGISSGSITVTDLQILKSSMRGNRRNALFTRLPFNNIAEVDISQSDIIVRRQFSVDITNNTTSVTLSAANETFLSFDEERYSLIRSDGGVEVLTEDRFNLSTNGKTITINNLGTNNVGADLITTIRKVNPVDKRKVRNRAQSLLVDKSKLRGSGIGATTLQNGLIHDSYPYGTRVEDRNISLNVPDVFRVYGIFEANRASDTPSAPRMVLTSISGATGSTDDVTLGEFVVGSVSQAKARVVNKENATTIDIINVNDNDFQAGEVVTFEESQATAIMVSVTDRSRDISDYYELDNGQRLSYYDYARLVRKREAKIPTKKIIVYFESGSFDASDTGDVTTLNSYADFEYEEIPYFKSRIKNSDMLDIRPRVSEYSVTVGARSPFEFGGRNFNQTGNSNGDVIASDEDLLISSMSYYQGRIDKIFLNKNGEFQLIQGTPSDDPQLPKGVDDSIEIATIELPPYLYDVGHASVTLNEYKRYRMQDIRQLEQRISNLEEAATLSLLESETNNLFIPDAQGLNKFKSGFFVDNFTTLLTQDDESGLKNSIDAEQQFMRPEHYCTELDLVIGSDATLGIGTFPRSGGDPDLEDGERGNGLDPTQLGEINGSNVRLTGDSVTLDYDEIVWKSQTFATRFISVTPYLVRFWRGHIRLNPSVDVWTDQVRLKPKTTKVMGNYNETINKTGVNPKTGLGPKMWGSWNTVWTGKPEWKYAPTPNQRRARGHGPNSEASKSAAEFEKALRTNNTLGPRKWIGGSGQFNAKGVIPTTGRYAQTVESTQKRTGKQLKVKAVWERKSLGDTVLSTELATFMRSRNVEARAHRFKSFTRIYPFLQRKKLSPYITPQLLEIEMIRGTFQPNEVVVGRMPGVKYKNHPKNTQPRLRAVICVPNRRWGRRSGLKPGQSAFVPDKRYAGGRRRIFSATLRNPYNPDETLPSAYSTTSNILNIDTNTLARLDGRNAKYFGFTRGGMIIKGLRSGAVCRVKPVRIVTDNFGFARFCWFIPNPNAKGTPRWLTNGPKTFRLTDSKEDKRIKGALDTAGQTKYEAKGTIETVQEQIISVKNAVVEEVKLEQTKKKLDFTGLFIDPIAQSFACDDVDGVYVTSVEVFFQAKDNNGVPVTCQLRTMQTGLPTTTVLPFSNVDKNPDEIELSNNATVPTRFVFDSPVYLEGRTEYCVVFLSNSTEYKVAISRMGEVDLRFRDEASGEKIRVNTQPTLGSLFKSQNASTWTPSQYEDLTFQLYRAEFVESGEINFFNTELDNGNDHIPILNPDPLEFTSKTIRVGLSATVAQMDANSNPGLTIGTRIFQNGSDGQGKLQTLAGIATGDTTDVQSNNVEGNLSGKGGTEDSTDEQTGLAGLLLDNSGVGFPPLNGHQLYTNVSMTSLTGHGRDLTCDLSVTDGVVAIATVRNGGSGYQVGDVVTAGVGNSSLGENLRVVVGLLTAFDEFTISSVQGNFLVGSGATLRYDNASTGVGTDLNFGAYVADAGIPVRINNLEVVEKGIYMRVNHINHGMYGLGNLVNLFDITSDIPTTTLNAAYDQDSTAAISLVDASDFEEFEGVAVSASNPGYIKIVDEILSYTGVTGNTLTGITRNVDSGDDDLTEPYDIGEEVEKYEINGVSIRRLQGVNHSISFVTAQDVDDPLSMDHYTLSIPMDTAGGRAVDRSANQTALPQLFLRDTGPFGGNLVRATENIQFEAITPNVAVSNPNGTSISARLRTVSGTSPGGNEPPFARKEDDVTLNQTNYLNSPRLIGSELNEELFLRRFRQIYPGAKSLALRLSLATNNTKLSPIIDATRCNVITTGNRINRAVVGNEFKTDLGTKTLSDDKNNYVYVTNRIQLENPATSIKVIHDAYVHRFNDLRVFYAISNTETDDPVFTPFPGFNNIDKFGNTVELEESDGTPDVKVEKNPVEYYNSDAPMVEYEYTANDLPEFTYFRIKIVGTSRRSSVVPIVESLRVIATA